MRRDIHHFMREQLRIPLHAFADAVLSECRDFEPVQNLERTEPKKRRMVKRNGGSVSMHYGLFCPIAKASEIVSGAKPRASRLNGLSAATDEVWEVRNDR